MSASVFREAGLRTHMLICVGSALIMIVSAYGFAEVLTGEQVVLDPSRMANLAALLDRDEPPLKELDTCEDEICTRSRQLRGVREFRQHDASS
jgi:hypothetical protein